MSLFGRGKLLIRYWSSPKATRKSRRHFSPGGYSLNSAQPLFRILIDQFSVQAFQPLAVASAPPYSKEAGITAMGRFDAAGMFDRAPVLLGTCCYLPEIAGQAIFIRVVDTVVFSNQIQVRQILPVEHEVVHSAYLNITKGRLPDVHLRMVPQEILSGISESQTQPH